jgi:RNA polymerase sigma-70 factor (ECF subfamily)
MNTSPENLWQKAVEGNQKAWQQLYKLFSGRLYQFFVKNTRDQHLAMDKVQEVFIKIYRNKDSFKYGSLKTWVFRIAKNTLIDEWRRCGKLRKGEVLSDILPEIVANDDNVEEKVLGQIEHKNIVSMIDECLIQMQDSERLLIGLVYLGSLSVPELADVMDWPLGTTKTRVRSARLRLDALMSEKMKLESSGVKNELQKN